MRLFIAVPVPVSVRRALFAARCALESGGASGRFVPMENYHVTIKFIGESEALPEIVAGMQSAVRDAKGISLHLTTYGRFAGGKGGHTGVVLLDDVKGELSRLQSLVESALSDQGFSRGHARFVPHITLGRNMSGDDAGVIVRPEHFTADSLVLYESRSGKYGMEYLPLHREVF